MEVKSLLVCFLFKAQQVKKITDNHTWLENAHLFAFQAHPRMRGHPQPCSDPEADQSFGHRLRAQPELEHEERRPHRVGSDGHCSRKSKREARRCFEA